MRIKLTRHAKNRKRWRRISDEEIKITLESPDTVEEDNGAKVACKRVGKRWIKVPYVIEREEIVVLTVKAKEIKEQAQ